MVASQSRLAGSMSLSGWSGGISRQNGSACSKRGTSPAGKVRDKVRHLAAERLDEHHAGALGALIDEVEAAQRERNEVLHSRWLLRGPDSMGPVGEFLALDEEDRLNYLGQWERESRESDDWTLQRSRSMQLSQPFGIEQLIRVERRLFRAEEGAVQWHFRLASMREVGAPPGWRGPDAARRGPQPLPPSAVTGPAAVEALTAFVEGYREARGFGPIAHFDVEAREDNSPA